MSKIITFVLFLFWYIQVILCDGKVPRATAEDAEKAFDEYHAFSSALLTNITNEINSFGQSRIHEFYELQNITVQTLNNKLDDVIAKIEQMEKRLSLLGIDTCTAGYIDKIEAYRERLIAHTNECTELSVLMISNITSVQTNAEIRWKVNTNMGCYAKSRAECGMYGKEDGSCFDFVIDNIKTARTNMETSYQYTRVNMLNKILSFKLPCQDLINFEISVYPDYNLQTITQCAQVELRNSRPFTCPK